MRLVFRGDRRAGAVYLLFAGHNQPGGGFVGGLVAGAAVGLRYVAGGIDEVRSRRRSARGRSSAPACCSPPSPASVPLVLGASGARERRRSMSTSPLLGDVNVTTALVFDIGVYLVVVGLVLMVFEAFGDDPPVSTGPVDEEATASPERAGPPGG